MSLLEQDPLDSLEQIKLEGWAIDIVHRFKAWDHTLSAEYVRTLTEKQYWLYTNGLEKRRDYRIVERQIGYSGVWNVEYHWLFKQPKHASLFALKYSTPN